MNSGSHPACFLIVSFFFFSLRNVICLVLVAPSFIYVFIFKFSFPLSPLYHPASFSIHSFRFRDGEAWPVYIFWKTARAGSKLQQTHKSAHCTLGWNITFASQCSLFFAATTHSVSGRGDIVELVDRNWRLQVVSKVLSSETWVRSQQSFLLWSQKMGTVRWFLGGNVCLVQPWRNCKPRPLLT